MAIIMPERESERQRGWQRGRATTPTTRVIAVAAAQWVNAIACRPLPWATQVKVLDNCASLILSMEQ